MPEEFILYLTPIGIIFIFAIKEFFHYLREKNNKKSVPNLNNHLSGINVKLDNLQTGINELDRKMERVTELLVLIKDYLKK